MANHGWPWPAMANHGPTWPAKANHGHEPSVAAVRLARPAATKNPKQTNRVLTDIVPVISSLMWDTKAQVKEEGFP